MIVVALPPDKWPRQDLLPLDLLPILLPLPHLMLVADGENDAIRMSMMVCPLLRDLETVPIGVPLVISEVVGSDISNHQDSSTERYACFDARTNTPEKRSTF